MESNKTIKIVKDEEGRYIYAAMPDGKIIPMQLDIHMNQLVKQPSFVRVRVTLNCDIPIDEFEILKADKLIVVEESDD